MRDEVMGRAREMLAAEWDAVGRVGLASSIRRGRDDEWSKAGPAIRAIAKALSREDEIRAEERERCARICDAEAEALAALPNPLRSWTVTHAKARLAHNLASAIRSAPPVSSARDGG